MSGKHNGVRLTGITHRQLDGSVIDSSLCTCEPSWVMDWQLNNVFCPIDVHATRARQDTWEFDDDGNIYTYTPES